MIAYQQVFHIGVRVPSLDEAMSEYGEALGVTWAAPFDLPAQSVWTPEAGAREVALKFTYSAEGPQHLELLEGEPGSPWHGDDSHGAHHVGVWVDDIAAEAARLIELGWVVTAANLAPDDGFGMFAYLQPSTGLIVELVDRSVAAAFEPWWAAALDR